MDDETDTWADGKLNPVGALGWDSVDGLEDDDDLTDDDYLALDEDFAILDSEDDDAAADV